MKANQLALVAAAVAGLFTTQAQASMLTFVGMDASRGSNVTFTYNGSQESGFAGALEFSNDGGPIFETYCVDVTTYVYVGQTYQVQTIPPSSLGNGGLVAYLFNTFAPTVNDINSGTALQIAIWEALYDGGTGLSNGNFQINTSGVSQAIIDQANSYLTASAGHSSTSGVVWQSIDGPGGMQMQIGSGVPEPSSMVLSGMGLLLAAFGARRKFRK